jgi:LysR family transcriptional regulator, nitrogen assimilation regulatory protein
MDLRHIRCFVAAYEEGSFSKAAKREHSTQSGVSVCIQQLEATVSHKLFERSAGGVVPTLAGRHLYACCTDVLKSIQIAQQRMQDMKGSSTGTINLGFPPSMFKVALPTMLPKYVSDHPFVDLRLAEAYSGTLNEWVVSGEIDAAIVTKPPMNLGLEISHYFRDQLMLVTRKGGLPNGSGSKNGHFEANELRKLNLILPSAKHSMRQMIESTVQLGGSASGKVLDIDGMLGTLELVRNSDWATIAAKINVVEEVRDGKLDAKPIAHPELWLDLFLVQTKGSFLSAPCRDFLQRLKKTLERIPNI